MDRAAVIQEANLQNKTRNMVHTSVTIRTVRGAESEPLHLCRTEKQAEKQAVGSLI